MTVLAEYPRFGAFSSSATILNAPQDRSEYIAQPGGSIRDDNVIETCNRYKMVMAFNGRLFHH